MATAGPLYECKVDIGPHVLMPRLERLEVWADRLVFQRETPLQIPLSAIDKAELKTWWGSSVILLHYRDFIGHAQSLRFADSNRLTPNNSQTQLLHTILQKLLSQQREGVQAGDLFAARQNEGEAGAAVVQRIVEAQAGNEMKWWGAWLIFGGVVSVAGGAFLQLFSVPWGIFVLALGLVAWRTRELPWLVVIGVALLWAAFENLLAGESRLFRSGAWQILLGGTAIYRYANLRKRLERPLDEVSPAAGLWLPWLSLGGSLLSILGFVAAVLAYTLFESETVGDVLSELVTVFMVLGVGAGLSHLLAFRTRRVMSVVGLLLGVLVVGVLLYLAFA